jgi:aspartyl-tRNA(Asn)/glutamyl-tRNA(Gln) amidotransferase subunit B
MEVHAQVLSNSKLFSGASTEFGAEPNSQVSFIDAGFPGMLPVINEKCIEQAVRTGLGLKAKINLRSLFDRKNYFYPDLPQGYQISQYKDPIVGEGEVLIDLKDGETIRVGIERLHLEQDAGKSLHDQHPDNSFVDLNRSGIALMEIVTKPHMRSSEEAAAFLRKLRAIVRYLGTCDGNMDEGSMRADVNVSVCRVGGYDKFRQTGDFKHLGTRCEIKNVNSMRFIAQAVEYEARRQIEVIEGGGTIRQETRLYDSKLGETRSMRSKEEAHDYRYFPDPDLLPLELDAGWVESIKKTLPELPDEKKSRFMGLGLSAYDASVLVAERELADFYEELAKGVDAKAAANWLNNEILGRLNRDGLSITQVPVSAAANNAIIRMIPTRPSPARSPRDLLDIVWAEGGDPRRWWRRG